MFIFAVPIILIVIGYILNFVVIICFSCAAISVIILIIGYILFWSFETHYQAEKINIICNKFNN